ncbi:MAG TPA: ferritin-like domain-containing protein [Frankiaceae bacterium]|nr:ferritin-like domain-containing protein [Frankiaceae bacterium]
MADDDAMDVPEVQRRLAAALRLQYRSALLHAIAAGVVGGPDGVLATDLLAEYAALELADVGRLADKLVSLDGTPPADLGTLPALSGALKDVLTTLVETDDETIAALHKVIEPSGQEPRSEALEHLIEHVITRKQAQVDRLRRALR